MATDSILNAPTGIVTLVFSDIVGSTQLSERLREPFEAARTQHFALLRNVLRTHKGYEVTNTGDGLFVAFGRVSDAVRWAVDVQRAFLAESWPADVGQIHVRVGMHTGEAVALVENGHTNYFGTPVNRAARVSGAAHGQQILVSAATYSLAQNDVGGEGIGFRDLKSHRLKGIGSEHLYQVTADDLPDTFPPPVALASHCHNLPLPPTPFLGREIEIADICRLLNVPQTRLVTITGFGGIGKTRLAQHVAELLVDHFAGGVWWSDLSETHTGDEMAQRIAYDLQLNLQPPPSARERMVGFLKERAGQTLLFLDNVEQVQNADLFVRDLLRDVPNVVCLVTSRRTLQLRSELTYELHPLPDTDATAFFAERARAARADFAVTEQNCAAVTELCHSLEGVPLALELAAARIVGMTPHQMLTRIGERFRILQSRNVDMPERQRGLRAVVDWSYELLDEETRVLFAQLSVFAPTGFTMEDAEAVCDNFDVFEGILLLRAQSFLSTQDEAAQETQFRMLEFLRLYAGERLDERGMDVRHAASQRHARHYQQRAEAYLAQLRTDKEADALAALEHIAENLRLATEWAQNADVPAVHASLCLALGVRQQKRGFQQEAVAPIAVGLAAARAGGDAVPPILLLRLLLECAGLHLDAHESALGQPLILEALALATQNGASLFLGEAENLLGRIAMEAKNYADAHTHYERARLLFEEANSPVMLGVVHNNIGLAHYHDPDEDNEAAVVHLREALRLRRSVGDNRGEAVALNNLGTLAFDARDWPHAEESWRTALSIERRLQNRYGAAILLNNLGEVAEEQERFDRAAALYAAAEHLFREIGHAHVGYATARLNALTAKTSSITDARISELRGGLTGKSLGELCAAADAPS